MLKSTANMGVLMATEAVKDDTRLDQLSSSLITNSRIGATTAGKLPAVTGMQTSTLHTVKVITVHLHSGAGGGPHSFFTFTQ